MWKPKKRPNPKSHFSHNLDEKLVIDRSWYILDISDKGVVKVYNRMAFDKEGGYQRVFINERGWFKGTPHQIKLLKEKLEKL